MKTGRLSRETVEAIYTSKDSYATLMQRHNCTWTEVNRIRGNVQYLRFTALLARPTRPRTRIPEEMKEMIRKSTGTVAEVAREFGIGMNTVCLIRPTGKRYVPPSIPRRFQDRIRRAIIGHCKSESFHVSLEPTHKPWSTGLLDLAISSFGVAVVQIDEFYAAGAAKRRTS
jgi:hypothetical protein